MTATVRGISIDDASGTINKDGEREYRIVYKVQVDDKRDGAAAVRTAFGIPNLGDTYQPGNDSDFGAVVVSKEPRRVDAFEWEVEVLYSTNVGNREPKQYANPLAEPPEKSFGFEERRILIPGRFNDPIGPPTNKSFEQGIFAPNGELFDPQPEATYADPVWTIKRNVALTAVTEVGLLQLANAVNSDYFQNVEPRQLKMKPPTIVSKWHKSIGDYWEISYSLVYRWETWDIQVLNQGSYYFAGGKPTSVWSTTVNRKIKKDESGVPIIVNLTTNGDINTSATPTFTRIRFYRELPFGALGIL